jgi:general secretion pathway protein B
MSFILDALRKSDAERQRTVTPGLADARYAAPRSRRTIWWLPILVVVLAANGVFMAMQWFDRSANAPAPEPVVSIPAPDTESPRPSDIRPLARESEFGEPLFEPPLEIERDPPMVQEMAEPAPAAPGPAPEFAAAAEVPAAPASAKPSRIIAGNELPTAEQLIGSGTLNIPLLNLDLHVYSDQPASRFVVINTRKYKEGEQLTEGPTIESITINGVVLSSQGRRFTLLRK